MLYTEYVTNLLLICLQTISQTAKAYKLILPLEHKQHGHICSILMKTGSIVRIVITMQYNHTIASFNSEI